MLDILLVELHYCIHPRKAGALLVNEEALHAWMDAEATRGYTPMKQEILRKAKVLRVDAHAPATSMARCWRNFKERNQDYSCRQAELT